MNTKTTIPISEARKRIFEIADSVQKPRSIFTLTVDGRPKVVMLSAEKYESLMETMEVIRDNPDLTRLITETKQSIKNGAVEDWSTLEDLKRDWGFAPASKKAFRSKKISDTQRHYVSSRISSASKKKSR